MPQVPAKRINQKKSKERYPHRICIMCQKKIRHIDVHAQKVHLAKRGTSYYDKIMKGSTLMLTDNADANTEKLSVTDELKLFLSEFDKYLRNCSSIAETTIKAQTRIVGEIFCCRLPSEINFDLNDYKIAQILTEVHSEDPPGLFSIKKQMFIVQTIKER